MAVQQVAAIVPNKIKTTFHLLKFKCFVPSYTCKITLL